MRIHAVHVFHPIVLVPMLFGLAFLIGIVVLVIVLVRSGNRPATPVRPASLAILEERYARGEISREEFLERRAVLLGDHSTPAAP